MFHSRRLSLLALVLLFALPVVGSAEHRRFPSRSAGVPLHVMTWTTIQESDHVPFGWREAARWVTWVSTGAREAVRARAVGIHTARYADPNLLCSIDSGCIGDAGSSYVPDESAFEHCNGIRDAAHRATTSYNQETVQWIGKADSPALVTALRRYLRSASRNEEGQERPFDAVWLDDVVLPHDRWPPKTWQASGFSAKGEGTSCGSFPWDGYRGDEAQLEAWRDFHRKSPLPVIVEGLGAMGYGPYDERPSHTVSLVDNRGVPRRDPVLGNVTGNTLGGVFEGAWGGMNQRRPKERPPFWQKASNDQIQLVGYRKLFFEETYARARDLDVRGYVYASFLLTYDPRLSVYGIDDRPGYRSRLSVGQETTLVPLDPVQTASRDIAELRSPQGAYRREFRRCFIAGRPVGGCAVVVNPDPYSSVPLPHLSGAYAHSLILQGAGLLPKYGDDGRLRTDGPPLLGDLPPSGWGILLH